jgi:hypothetical protein
MEWTNWDDKPPLNKDYPIWIYCNKTKTMYFDENILDTLSLPANQGYVWKSMKRINMREEEFEMWAVGQVSQNGKFVTPSVAMDFWNERHGGLLKIDANEIELGHLDKMKNIYGIMKHYPDGMYGYVETLIKMLNDSLRKQVRDAAITCEFDDLNRDHPKE